MEDLIKTILIDDDEEALILLETYLKLLPDIELIGKASSGEDGLKLISENLPALVFLDIDMPDISGVEIARIIKERNYKIQIVFTTAFNKYAYDVIVTEPLAYMVKPFGPEELESVVSKFRQKQNKEEDDRKFEILIQSQKISGKFKFPTRNGVVILHVDEIALIRANGNSCIFYLGDGSTETVNCSLNKVTMLFANLNVHRIGRSTAINMRYLRRVDRTNQTCTISVKGSNYEEPLSRRSINFFERMKCFPIE